MILENACKPRASRLSRLGSRGSMVLETFFLKSRRNHKRNPSEQGSVHRGDDLLSLRMCIVLGQFRESNQGRL